MANPHRGEVTFKVADAEYTLAFSTNAICEVETLLDKGLNQIVQSMDRLTTIRALFWAGLREHHPMTLEEAGVIMHEAGAGAASKAVNQAMSLAFPQPSKKGSAGKNP